MGAACSCLQGQADGPQRVGAPTHAAVSAPAPPGAAPASLPVKAALAAEQQQQQAQQQRPLSEKPIAVGIAAALPAAKQEQAASDESPAVADGAILAGHEGAADVDQEQVGLVPRLVGSLVHDRAAWGRHSALSALEPMHNAAGGSSTWHAGAICKRMQAHELLLKQP